MKEKNKLTPWQRFLGLIKLEKKTQPKSLITLFLKVL